MTDSIISAASVIAAGIAVGLAAEIIESVIY